MQPTVWVLLTCLFPLLCVGARLTKGPSSTGPTSKAAQPAITPKAAKGPLPVLTVVAGLFQRRVAALTIPRWIATHACGWLWQCHLAELEDFLMIPGRVWSLQWSRPDPRDGGHFSAKAFFGGPRGSGRLGGSKGRNSRVGPLAFQRGFLDHPMVNFFGGWNLDSIGSYWIGPG